MFSSFNYNLSFFFLKAKDSLLAGGQNTSSWAGGLPAESRENDFRHRLEPVFLVLGTLQILLWVYFSWVETLPGFANDMGLFVTLDPSGAHREGSCLESVPLSSLVLMKEELWCLLPTTLDFCQISLVVLSLNMSHLPPKPRQCFLYQQQSLDIQLLNYNNKQLKYLKYKTIFHLPLQLANIFEMLLLNTGEDNVNHRLLYNAIVNVNFHNPECVGVCVNLKSQEDT